MPCRSPSSLPASCSPRAPIFRPPRLPVSGPALQLVAPAFTLDALAKIAVPLFVITMASQNLTGLAVMRANGYEVSAGPTFLATGLLSGIVAVFGGLTINLAAITAALMAGRRRTPIRPAAGSLPWPRPPAIWSSASSRASAAAFIAASPPILIEAVAGLALLPSLALGPRRLARRRGHAPSPPSSPSSPPPRGSACSASPAPSGDWSPASACVSFSAAGKRRERRHRPARLKAGPPRCRPLIPRNPFPQGQHPGRFGKSGVPSAARPRRPIAPWQRKSNPLHGRCLRALEHSAVAQLVEHSTVNRMVLGSSPSRGAHSPEPFRARPDPAISCACRRRRPPRLRHGTINEHNLASRRRATNRASLPQRDLTI